MNTNVLLKINYINIFLEITEEGNTVSQIFKKLNVTMGTIFKLIKILEENKIVFRKVNKKKRSERTIYLTKNGLLLRTTLLDFMSQINNI